MRDCRRDGGVFPGGRIWRDDDRHGAFTWPIGRRQIGRGDRRVAQATGGVTSYNADLMQVYRELLDPLSATADLGGWTMAKRRSIGCSGMVGALAPFRVAR